MVWLDARLPIRFGPRETLAEGEMLLTAAELIGFAAHLAGCDCCVPRSVAAQALATLFRDRVLAPGPLPKAVLAAVDADGEAAIRDAVLNDGVASTRFRLQEPTQP